VKPAPPRRRGRTAKARDLASWILIEPDNFDDEEKGNSPGPGRAAGGCSAAALRRGPVRVERGLVRLVEDGL
jgi:hypothetical protein